jgi:hypothetical protein
VPGFPPQLHAEPIGSGLTRQLPVLVSQLELFRASVVDLAVAFSDGARS